MADNQTPNANRGKKLNWSNISFIFLIGTSLGIQVIGQAMLNVGLGWETDIKRLLIKSTLNTFSIILIVFGVIFHIIAQFKENNEDYKKMLSKIMDTYYKVYKQIVWDMFKEKANRKRKIKQWKADLILKENKLEALNKKDKVNGESNRRIWYKGTAEEKSENQYCIEKNLLRTQASSQWIEENLDYILVNYDEISYSAIFIGKVKSKEALPANDFISKHDNLTIFIENIPRILMGSGFILFLSSLVFDGLVYNQEFYVNSFFILVGMSWNLYLAIKYANNFCDTRVIGSMMFRYGVTDEYSQFVQSHNVKEPELIPITQSPKTKDEDQILNEPDGTPEKSISQPM